MSPAESIRARLAEVRREQDALAAEAKRLTAALAALEGTAMSVSAPWTPGGVILDTWLVPVAPCTPWQPAPGMWQITCGGTQILSEDVRFA